MSLRGLLLALTLALAAQPAWACNPDLLDSLLNDVEAQITYAVRAPELEASRAHLRRGAFDMAEAEMQLISCNCANASAMAGNAVTDIRRASNSLDIGEMAIAVEASIVGWQVTVDALAEDLCR